MRKSLRFNRPILTIRGGIACAVAIGAAAFALGCGSDSDSSTSSASASAGTSTANSAATSKEVADAKAFTAKYLKSPTSISVTQPLKEKPTPGKMMVYAQDELPNDTFVAQGLKAALATAGWNLKIIPYKSTNPAQLVTALKQALQYHPVAVTFSAAPKETWSSILPDYKAAGVALIPQYVGDIDVTDPVIANIAPPETFALAGQLLGSWFIADSNGEGHALFLNVTGIPILQPQTDEFVATTKKCTACNVTVQDAPLTAVASNGIAPLIVSALRRDPSIKYVVLAQSAFVPGLAGTLKGAGLQDIQIAGGSVSAETEGQMQNGEFTAGVGVPLKPGAWLVADTAFRFSQKIPVQAKNTTDQLPTMLITKDNLPHPFSNSLDVPTDYQEQFKKLWMVDSGS